MDESDCSDFLSFAKNYILCSAFTILSTLCFVNETLDEYLTCDLFPAMEYSFENLYDSDVTLYESTETFVPKAKYTGCKKLTDYITKYGFDFLICAPCGKNGHCHL